MPQFRRKLASGAAVLALVSGAPAAASGPDAVEISDAGLAWMTHAIDAGSGDLSLSVPRDRLDTLLGSFTLTGHGFTGPRLSLAGPGTLSEALEGFLLTPDEISSAERMLAALSGHDVEIETLDGNRSGKIMGVTFRTGCDAGVCADLLLRQDEDGRARVIAMESIVSFTATDPRIEGEIDRVLDVLRLRRDDGRRDVTLSFENLAENAAGVAGYMVPTAPWKITWRVLLDEDAPNLLQGWAVVRNDTGQDWEDVALTLSSGSPLVMTDRLFGEEPEAQPARVLQERFSVRTMDAESSMDVAAMAPTPLASPVDMTDGDVSSRYALPDPVTLPAGQMVSLPLLEQELPDVRMSRYRAVGRTAAVPGSPERVLQIRNDLDVRLPEGIASLSAPRGEGFIGNARMPQLLPGEERLIAFGTDDRLTVLEGVRQERVSDRIFLRDGGLIIEERDIVRTSYRIEARGEEGSGVLLIDHPHRGDDWAPPRLEEGEAVRHMTPGDVATWRIQLDLDGEPRTISVLDSRPVRSHVALRDMNADQVLSWSGRATDEATTAALERYLSLVRAAQDAEAALERARQDIANETAEQQRRMTLMGQFSEGNDAHRRFSAEVVELEDRIQELRRHEEALQQELRERRGEVAGFLDELRDARP